ncbi:MAG: tetratricopeptide repeat protein, partial [Steroidobacteraceae bacterium]
MKTHRVVSAFVMLATMFACTVWADTDPSVHQIYQAEQRGDLPAAHRMLEEVLRDHPRSGKAHFVAAELYARAGNLERARAELSTARSLEPGLPFEKPEAVRALERELAPPWRAAQSVPWLPLLAIAGFIFAIWVVMQRRIVPGGVYSQIDSGVPAVPTPP